MPKVINTDKTQSAFISMKVNMQNGIVTREIYGAKHIVLENRGSIPAGAVLNGILYTEKFLRELAKNTKGHIPAPAGHPHDDDGSFISGGHPRAMHQNYVGAISYNYRFREDDKMLVRDIAIDPEKAALSEQGRYIIDSVQNGRDMDTSTGLLLKLKKSSGIGKDGSYHDYEAISGELDHDALLTGETGAATSLQGVGLFANSEGDKQEVIECSLANASYPAMNLPIAPADHEWDEQAAIERIKAYTDSDKQPSANYRRFFMEFDRENTGDFSAYRMPFADVIEVNGEMVPHAVPAAIESLVKQMAQNMPGDDETAADVTGKYAARIKNSSGSQEAKRSIFQKCIRYVENLFSMEYNNIESIGDAVNPEKLNHLYTNKGDREMRDFFINKLKEAGVEVANDATEAELQEAFNKHFTAEKADEPTPASNSAEDIATAVSQAVANAVAPLNDKVEALEAKLNSEAKTKHDSLVEKAVANGLTESIAKKSSVEDLEAYLASNKTHVAGNYATGGFTANSKSNDYEMPE